MRYLDLTLPTAVENLALDEALLDETEASETPDETLRLWEPRQPMVVVGRSSQFGVEVRLDACRTLGIPVLRRPSGGAAIVAGPGCLMYALVLSYRLHPQLRILSEAHRWVLGTLAAALRAFAPGIKCQGTSDLAIGGRKFSGNSARLPPQSSPLSRHVAVRLPAGVGRALPDDAAADAGLSGRASARELHNQLAAAAGNDSEGADRCLRRRRVPRLLARSPYGAACGRKVQLARVASVVNPRYSADFFT